jgi:hypothetical protein
MQLRPSIVVDLTARARHDEPTVQLHDACMQLVTPCSSMATARIVDRLASATSQPFDRAASCLSDSRCDVT